MVYRLKRQCAASSQALKAQIAVCVRDAVIPGFSALNTGPDPLRLSPEILPRSSADLRFGPWTCGFSLRHDAGDGPGSADLRSVPCLPARLAYATTAQQLASSATADHPLQQIELACGAVASPRCRCQSFGPAVFQSASCAPGGGKRHIVWIALLSSPARRPSTPVRCAGPAPPAWRAFAPPAGAHWPYRGRRAPAPAPGTDSRTASRPPRAPTI